MKNIEKCSGVNCPMQVGYDVANCQCKGCSYRTPPMTNYERIKNMSVEELAQLLCNCSDCGNGRCYGNDLCTQGDGACNGLVKWLEQEVEK